MIREIVLRITTTTTTTPIIIIIQLIIIIIIIKPRRRIRQKKTLVNCLKTGTFPVLSNQKNPVNRLLVLC